MIEINNLWHWHGSLAILKDFTAQLERGKIYGLMGPNGAGKTSLMKILAGIYPLKHGSIKLNGTDWQKLTTLERSQKIGYVAQSPHVQFAYSVWDVASMGRYPHRASESLPYQKAIEAQGRKSVQKALEQTELWSKRDHSILELSGGELQRVFLARSLVQQAPFLVMDEPFSFLDLRQQLNLCQILRESITDSRIALISLHEVRLAQHICDEVILMRDGKLFMSGKSEQLLNQRYLEPLYDLEANSDFFRSNEPAQSDKIEHLTPFNSPLSYHSRPYDSRLTGSM